MTGFKNFFSHKSFRQKLLFTYIGIILIPLGLITGFIFGNIATTIKKTTQVTAYRSHLQALAYLDSILINMKNSTNTILYDEKFLNFFSAEDISVGDQTQMYDQTVTFLKITERSRALKRIRFFVDDRLIFSNDKRVFSRYRRQSTGAGPKKVA